MFAIRHLLISLLLTFLILDTAFAQVVKQNEAPASASVVTVANSAEHLRFAAPGNVVRMRLEVVSDSGQIVFDATSKGNVVDWTAQDGAGQHLISGTYLCAVTVTSLTGILNRRICTVSIQDREVNLGQTSPGQLTSAQEQAIGPIEKDSAMMVVQSEEAPAITLMAHNGAEGHIVRSTGALSFRIGDFFSGKDREQMRLTAEGNLGIGMSHPLARLDVDGLIRSSQGIVFPDGSIQVSAARRTFGAASLKPGQFGDHPVNGQGDDSPITPSIAGTGTTGQIPKWQNGPTGVLADSVISELNGSIGINGAPNPTFKLDVLGHNRFRGANVSFYMTGSKVGGNEWLFQTVDADGRLRIFENSTGSGERLSLTQNGNVGIGTPSPQQSLSVNGALNIDQAGLNNGSFNPGITFGSFSGEGISSKRSAGGNQFGLDFYTGSANRMSITPGGSIGIGTASPQQNLSVNGALNIDQAGLNNGSFNPGITFGSFSGEGISSKRSAGGNQFGLDFYTASSNRMSITPGGNVGIGTTNPTARLHVQSTGGISVLGVNSTGQAVSGSSHDGFGVIGNTVNGTAVYGSNGGSNTTGNAGFFEGRVNITGNLAANNLPGVEFDVPIDVVNDGVLFVVDMGQTATVKTITVDVPADGFLVLIGSIWAQSRTSVNPDHLNHGTLQLFDETSNTTFASAEFQNTFANLVYSTNTIQGVLPVSAGTRTISLKVRASDGTADQVLYWSNPGRLIAMYFPKRY